MRRISLRLSLSRPMHKAVEVGAGASSGPSMTGVIEHWGALERRGTIKAEETGKTFSISGTAAFETLMPSMLRSLNGAQVTFEADLETGAAKKIVIDMSTVKKLSLFTAPELSATTSAAPKGGIPTAPAKSAGGKLFGDSKPSSPADDEKARGLDPRYVDLPPHAGRKDIRNSVLFSSEDPSRAAQRPSTVDDTFSKPKQVKAVLGSKRVPDGESQPQVKREIVRKEEKGMILAWSVMHKSGLVVSKSAKVLKDGNFTPSEQFVVTGVNSFISATPSSRGRTLAGAEVSFSVVSYPESPALRGKVFAEDIVIERLMDEEEETASAAELAVDSSKENAPATPIRLYGVVGRWSGGQGSIEGSDQKIYYINSTDDFLVLDPNSIAVRGAVVTFLSYPGKEANLARQVTIVSEMTHERLKGQQGFSQMNYLPNPPVERMEHNRGDVDESFFVYGRIVTYHVEEQQGVIQLEPDQTERVKEILDMYEEEHRIASQGKAALLAAPPSRGLPDDRFLIRAGSRSIVDVDNVGPKLKKGARVKFCIGGVSRRVAHNVTWAPVMVSMSDPESGLMKEVEVDEFGHPVGLPPPAQQRSAEVEVVGGGGGGGGEGGSPHLEASPTATNHWLKKFERVGFNMEEYKKHRQGVTVPTGMEVLDSMEDDPWFKDPAKNKTLETSPGATAGDTWNVSAPGLMKMALQMQDPASREKAKKKAEDKLRPEDKAQCLARAKEAAPYYLKKIKEAQVKHQDPTFSFY